MTGSDTAAFNSYWYGVKTGKPDRCLYRKELGRNKVNGTGKGVKAHTILRSIPPMQITIETVFRTPGLCRSSSLLSLLTIHGYRPGTVSAQAKWAGLLAQPHWPHVILLQGREPGGAIEAPDKALCRGDSLPGDVEGCAVVDRRPHYGQSQSYVDPTRRNREAKRNVTLVVIHADDRVELLSGELQDRNTVSAGRPLQRAYPDSAPLDCRPDFPALLVAEQSVLAGNEGNPAPRYAFGLSLREALRRSGE